MKEKRERLQAIEARKLELRSDLEDSNKEIDLEAANTELDSLNAEADTLKEEIKKEEETRSNLAKGIDTGFTKVEIPQEKEGRGVDMTREEILNSKEYRSAYLKTLQGKELTEAEQRAYSTAAESGAEVVPTSLANEIIKKMYEVAPVLEKIRLFHVPGNFKIAVEGTNNDAAIHTENGAMTPAADKLGEVSLTGYEITKLLSASRAVLTMATDAFEAYLVELLAENIARKIENFIFTGTGTNQPGGVKIAGKGTDGAYVEGTDLKTIAAATNIAEQDVIDWFGMLGNGYERNGIAAMSKQTFFAYFHKFMNVGKNNVVTFSGKDYYILGLPVYFTGSVALGEAYIGDFSQIIGNFSQDITVSKSEHSGFTRNAVDFLGACVFDSKPVAGLGAFAKFVKEQA